MAAQIADIKSQVKNPPFFKESLRIMAERAVCAAKILNGSESKELRVRLKGELSFCHGAFHGEHLIMGNSGEIYITGLNHWIRDIRMRDLTDFLLFAGKANGWDRQFFQKLLTNYEQISPLLPQEIMLLQGYLLFPFGYGELLQELAQKEAGREETKKRLETYLQQEEEKVKCLNDLSLRKVGKINDCPEKYF